jgi:hypothetical protein
MELITEVGYFKTTCPQGLAGHFVTEDGMRSVYIASKEEGRLCLDAALRRGRFNQITVEGMRASLEASKLAENIKDVNPKTRYLVGLLNIEGVIGIGRREDGKVFVACTITDHKVVRRRVDEFLAIDIFPEYIKVDVMMDRFDTPFVADDCLVNVITMTV